MSVPTTKYTCPTLVTPTQFANTASVSNNSMRQQQHPMQSRYTTNSMFQRQLSTNALNSSSSSTTNNTVSPTSSTSSSKTSGPRLFQRQMTASQLFSSSSATSGAVQQDSGKQRALLANVRADPSLANSAACLASANYGPSQSRQQQHRADGEGLQQQQAASKKQAKNKRIISRMLSISAIHTTVGFSSNSDSQSVTNSDDATQLNEMAAATITSGQVGADQAAGKTCACTCTYACTCTQAHAQDAKHAHSSLKHLNSSAPLPPSLRENSAFAFAFAFAFTI